MAGGMSAKEYRLGPKTKTLLECDTFEDLYESFEAQLRYFVHIFAFIANKGQQERAANHSKLLKGVFTDGCLERGIDHVQEARFTVMVWWKQPALLQPLMR